MYWRRIHVLIAEVEDEFVCDDDVEQLDDEVVFRYCAPSAREGLDVLVRSVRSERIGRVEGELGHPPTLLGREEGVTVRWIRAWGLPCLDLSTSDRQSDRLPHR